MSSRSFLYIFGLSCFILSVLFNVCPHPDPITPGEPCNDLAVESLPRNYFLYNHVTPNFIKLTLAIILSIFSIFGHFISIKVRYISINSNLSTLRKSSKRNSAMSWQILFPWAHFLTCLALYAPFLVLIMVDDTVISYVPDRKLLFGFQKWFYSKIHKTCFLSFKYWTIFLVFSVYLLITVPFAAIWYFQLVISLSNDICENPGPVIVPQNDDISRYFSFCNWNLNTMSKDGFSRVHLLNAHNSIHKYDIISLCETSLGHGETVPENILPGYHYHECNHPSGKKQGGVGIFYRETLPIIIRDDLSFDECIVAELRFGRKKIFFTVLYRNPKYKADSPEFYSFMGNLLDLHSKILNEKPYLMIFTGDFNAHSEHWWPDGDSNSEGTQLNILFSELGLTQLISEPTHFREHCQPSCIDLIACDQPNLVIDSGVRDTLDSTCKHHITHCKLSIKTPKIPPTKREVWHYEKADRELIKRAITNFPWELHLNFRTTNSQVKFLNETILNIMKNFVPSSMISSNIEEPKWVTRDIKKLIRRQKKLYKKYRLSGFKSADKEAVDRIRDQCFQAIKESRENYLKSLGEKLIDKTTSSKTYWSIINSFLNKCKTPRIPPLVVAEKLIINCNEKVKLFNDYFLEQCTPINNGSNLPSGITLLTQSKLNTITVSEELISNILKSINVNKAQGPDNISGRMIELCGDNLALPLYIIFQNIIETGDFPTLWKSANVTPVHKKESKQIVKNYRPISLLPIIAKVFERILFQQMYNHFISNNLITKKQSGFRPNDSVTNQLIYLVHSIHSNLDINVDVRYVFLDMSKAFDKVWHEGLLFKLKQNGIDGKLLTLLESYLFKRQQRVVINGFQSEWGEIKSGVPQGSVLGPLLFLIYINDLEVGIKSHIKFFADDTSLFSVANDCNISANELNHDLEIISQWAYKWKMSFNPDPTKQAVQVIFSRKHNKNDHPSIYFNGMEVKTVNEHKHLGLTLDTKLTFASHINEKLSKARKGIGVLKSLSRYLSVKTLDQIYKTYIRPHLDFCDVIYHVPCITNPFDSSINLKYLMNTIERMQYDAALAITGAWKGTHLDKIYEELGWESLTNRRYCRRLFQFYKIQNYLVPQYLREPLPPPRNHSYGLRSENALREINFHSDRFRDSFYPDSMRCWNRLGNSLQNSLNLKSFKANLTALYRPSPKSIFDIHDTTAIRWLYQLRVGLSPLNEHKNRHNFLDTPSDMCNICNSTENLEHYFLYCVRYVMARNSLFEDIRLLDVYFEPLQPKDKIKVLLYGDTSLSKEKNKKLLMGTLKFLKETKRFS